MKSRAAGGLSRKKGSGTHSIGHMMVMGNEMEGTGTGLNEELDLSKAVHKEFLTLLSHLADPQTNAYSDVKVSKR